IKSENILVDEDWTVRIEEPGVSTARHVHPCRKYAFMSPEVFSTKTTYCSTAAPNIWSLAIILIEMISNRLPWEIAACLDPEYNRYMFYFTKDGDYFHYVFPVSKCISMLLYCMLNPFHPLMRPTPEFIRFVVRGEKRLFDIGGYTPYYRELFPLPVDESDGNSERAQLGNLSRAY
ncbi:hypothetical protein BDQ17DRAFT_1491983, partial [Cyathus striatus]